MGVLGPVQQFKGGRVPDVGHWLVVFRNNRPVSLQGTGGKVRKGWSAPLVGASVAELDSTPQIAEVEIRDIRTSDGYYVPSLVVEAHIRLSPEREEAQQHILDLIARDGERFFEAIEVKQAREIEGHVRRTLGEHTAEDVLAVGVQQLLFPRASFKSASRVLEVTSIQGVRWEEAGFAKQVRQASERDIAESRELEYRLAKVAREAHIRSLQHQLDAGQALSEQELQAELDLRQVELISRRAEALGIDPLAIAEPDLWQAIIKQHGELLDSLLHSEQLYPVLRSNPELMRALASRLNGRVDRIPSGRKADMLLDRADPHRVMELPAGTAATMRPHDWIKWAPMTVHPVVASCWRAVGGAPHLSGSGLATSGDKALLLLVSSTGLPSSSAEFEAQCLKRLRQDGWSVERVAVYAAHAEDWAAAIGRFLERMRIPSVDLTLREVADRAELVVKLLGAHEDAEQAHRRLNDVRNPILPAMEDLVDGKVDIRVVPARFAP